MHINLRLPHCPPFCPWEPFVNSLSPLVSLVSRSLEFLRLGGGLLTAHGASCLAGNRSKPGDPTMRLGSDLAEFWV